MFAGEQTLLVRWLRMSLGLAAATVFSAFVDAGTAAASCGDYVMVGSHGHADHGHSIPGLPTCHGPNCHRQAPLPVLPTKGLLEAPPVESACWSQRECSARPPLAGSIFEHCLWLAEGHSLPLLRPPCL